MSGLARRDEQFHRIVEDTGPGLWRLTAGYARTLTDREDLFQEILLAILHALPSFREESSLRTFAYRIGHNQGITHRRREKRQQPSTSLDDLPSLTSSPESEAIGEIERARLLEAIRSLPHGSRQVLVLHLEGLNHSEIGEILGISPNNVGVRLHRARTELKRHLEPEI